MNIPKTFGIAATLAMLSLVGVPKAAAQEVAFPPLERIVLKEGTFPTREALGQIGPGVTKDQLYALVGRPHFREGFRAREWDYLFHFRDGDEVTSCRLKVVFDGAFRGQSFHWLPAGCGDPPAPPAQPLPPPEPEATVQRFQLSGDALFAFDKYGTGDILPGGLAQLDSLADTLRAVELVELRVIGHADVIGSERANNLLSQRRAETVRSYLVSRGVRAEAISAVGLGETQPVKECDPALARAALVSCLAPNRRVEIVATYAR